MPSGPPVQEPLTSDQDPIVTYVTSLPPPVTPAIQSQAPSTTWSITASYEWDMGLRAAIPAAPIGTQTVLLRFRAPSCRKVVLWAAESWGAKMQIPSSDTQQFNEVLLTKIVSAACPGITPDGNQTWTITGQYVYQLQLPPGANDTLTIALGPYDPRSISVNVLSPADFNRQFVGPSVAPSGYNGNVVNY